MYVNQRFRIDLSRAFLSQCTVLDSFCVYISSLRYLWVIIDQKLSTKIFNLKFNQVGFEQPDIKKAKYIFNGLAYSGRKTLMEELHENNYLAPLEGPENYKSLRTQFSSGYSTVTRIKKKNFRKSG